MAWIPPGRSFVAHSYKDKGLPGIVTARLPTWVEPLTFPAIDVPPTETISGRLLDAIRQCQSLIWIDTENGRQSLWVALERDYARRASLEVFRFEASRKELQADPAEPLHLPVFTSYHRADRSVVRDVVRLMTERYLDVFFDQDLSAARDWQSEISIGLTSRLEAGGFCLAFWSRHAASSTYVSAELRRAAASHPDQLLTVWLDDTPLPPALSRRQALRILGSGGVVDFRLVDNLIVWIYWTIYCGTKSL